MKYALEKINCEQRDSSVVRTHTLPAGDPKQSHSPLQVKQDTAWNKPKQVNINIPWILPCREKEKITVQT